MDFEFQDFKKLYKNMREIEKEERVLPPIVNIKEFESWFSLLVSLIITAILGAFIFSNDSYSTIVAISQNMLLYIISGLIAMLGFIVAGLAIMLSITTHTTLTNTLEEGKIKYLLGVFASFVYVSVLMVILIIICFALYFTLGIKYDFIEWLYLTFGFLVAYTFLFILFYIVSLLVTCINIFVFNFKFIKK